MTVGAVPYVIIALAVFGMLMVVLGTLVDQITLIDNELMQDPTLPYSYERANTMNMLIICFRAMGFVALMCAGIFLIANGLQSQSGEI